MHIVSVLPISKSLKAEELTYFSKEKFDIGAVVQIPVRNKKIQGIVLSCKSATELKAEIKDLPFEIKKIEKARSSVGSMPAFMMEVIGKSAEYYAASSGQIIASVIPPYALPTLLSLKNIPGRRFEELLIQTSHEDRETIIKGIVRETLGKKESVYVFCPTVEKAKSMFNILSKGVPGRSFYISGESKKGSEEMLKEKTPSLVVATPSVCGMLREDTGTIVIEEESSRHYKSKRKPYIDARTFLNFAAKSKKIRICYADSLPRIETMRRFEEGYIGEFLRPRERILKPIQTLVVNIKDNEGEEFKVISKDLREVISYAEKTKKKLFIFASRKGIASQTICMDCKTTVLCNKCHAPTVLHKRNDGMIFICHHCGELRDAKETCKHCGSWNLKAFGIGTEKIVDEIQALIPKEKIFVVDSFTCKRSSDARRSVAKFFDFGTVLVGTEMALAYLNESSVDFAAVASLDSLFSIPDFRMNERIMHIILSLKNIAATHLLIQTRNPKEKIIELGLEGQVGRFIKEELAEREKLSFPPYSTFIKISFTGKRDRIQADALEVQKLLEEYKPVVFPAFIKTIKGNSILHMLLRLSASEWPNPKLREILLSLPQWIRVEVDPESIL